MPSLGVAYEAQTRDASAGEHWSGPAELVDRVAALAGTRAGDRIADIGCGLGGPARRLAALGCRVVAMDLVEPVVREAARRSDPSVRFASAEAARLPLHDASVDQVWCLGVAAHVTDLPRAALEAARVLRRRGVVALTEGFWTGARPPRFRRTAPQPWRPLRLRTLLEALDGAGLVPRVLPWPALDVPGALDAGDPLLRRDLREGRIVPGLVLARKPGP